MWIVYVDASLSSEGDKIGQKGQKWTEMKGIWSQSAAGSRCALHFSLADPPPTKVCG